MKKLFLVLTVIAGFLSCSNESKEATYLNESSDGVLNFIYKEIPYSSSYILNMDNTITLQNIDANRIYQQLQELPELATVIDGDVVKFFDNYVEYQKTIKVVDGGLTKAIGDVCRWSITAFTSVEYKGVREVHSGVGEVTYSCNKVSYDNNWGSMTLFRESPGTSHNCIFTFYDNGDCGGHSLTFTLSGENTQENKMIRDLRGYVRSTFGRDWDNKISSFRIQWIVN